MEIKPCSVNGTILRMSSENGAQPYKPSVLLKDMGNTKGQIRRRRTRLHCLITECSKDEKYPPNNHYSRNVLSNRSQDQILGYCDGRKLQIKRSRYRS